LEANKLQLETEEVTPRDPKFSFNTGTLGVLVFEDLQQAVRLGFSVRANRSLHCLLSNAHQRRITLDSFAIVPRRHDRPFTTQVDQLSSPLGSLPKIGSTRTA
jgi:hypothetical protein